MLLSAEPLLIDFGQTGSATTYSNISSSYVAGTSITTPAHQNGLASSYDTYNNVGTADVSSGMVWGDNSAASGVTLAFGRATSSGGAINYSDSSNLSLASASPGASNDEFDSGLFKGSTDNTSQQAGEEAVAISNLPSGTYTVYVINNTISASGELCNDQIGTNISAYNATLAQLQGPLDFDGIFNAPGDFVASTVAINTGDKLDVVVHGFGSNAGYQKFNLLEVVPTSLLNGPGNQVVPQTAAYRGASPLGPGYVNVFNQWTANINTWSGDGEADSSWSNIDDAAWLYNGWGPWVAAQAGRNVAISVPMLLSSGTTLAQGAAGDFTSGSTNYYQILAQNLVSAGLGNSIIRLGWEFNGNWYPWYAGKNSGDSGSSGNFVNYWRLIVTDMRATAPNLKFDWNVSLGLQSVTAEPEYPGNAYVDYIGLDVYDASYLSNTYPFPTNDSAADMEARRELATSSYMNETEGLLYWSQFAAAQGKPLSIPEWGVWDKSDGHGGLDDPYFIQMVKAFISNPANNVAFESYFDVDASDGNHQLSPGPTGTSISEFPNSASEYQTLFSGTETSLNTNEDIGSPSLAGTGSYTADDNSYTLLGSGSGIGGAFDQFHLTSETVTGDQVLGARVTSVSSSIPAAQAGLMMRDGTGTSASYVDLTDSPGSGIVFQYRNASGGVGSVVAAGPTSSAVWMRLTRTGNTFTAYYATTTLAPGPSDWHVAGSVSIAFVNSSYQAGFAVTSASNALLATATFDTLTIESEPLPTGWTNTDIGSPASPGSGTNVMTGYTVSGGGAGIGGTSDQFNFTSQTAAGDQILVAEVNGVVSTVSTAEAGLMFRDSTASGAANALLDVQPNGSISFSYRGTTSAAETTVAGAQGNTPTLSAPIWLKLARSGSTITAYYATGTAIPTNWTQVGSAITTAMNAGSYLAGLVSTAGSNSGALCTAVFHSVAMGLDPIGHKIGLSPSSTVPADYAMVNLSTTNGIAYESLYIGGYGSVGTQQAFIGVDAGNGNIALRSVQTGFYLRYDPADGSLRADQDTTIGTYDIFQWIIATNNTYVALQSIANGTYMIYNYGSSIAGNAASTLTGQTEFNVTNVVAAPTVTSVSPATGPYTGGTSVVITGTDFTNASNVSFGSTVLGSSSFVINSPTQITAAAPTGTPGLVNITVTTSKGTSATSSADDFTYSALPGWLAQNSVATYNRTTGALVVSGATTIIDDPLNYGSSPIITTTGGATAVLTINPSVGTTPTLQIHIASLNLSGGATAVLTSLGSARTPTNIRVLVIAAGTNNLVIDSQSHLDLQDNDLIVHGGNLATINGLLASGYGAGAGYYWNGPGIDSGEAASQTQHLTAIGIIQNVASGGTPIYTSIDGVTGLTSTDVIVRYTYYGDANLDEQVDGSDYTLIDNGFNNKLTGWSNGDFNYDGVIDGSDYTLIDNAYNMQGTHISEQIAVHTAKIASSRLSSRQLLASPYPFQTQTLIAIPTAQLGIEDSLLKKDILDELAGS
jgi:hypothetical protein